MVWKDKKESCTGGTYQYRITQILGKRRDCTYDSHVFQVNIAVVQGEGLTAHVIIARENEPEKWDTVTYTNMYQSPNAPEKGKLSTVSTGDSQQAGWWLTILILATAVAAKRLRR